MLLDPPGEDNNRFQNNRSNRKPKEVLPNPRVSALSFERQLQLRVLLDQVGSITTEKPTPKNSRGEKVEYSGYVRVEEAEVLDYQNNVKEVLTELLLQNFALKDAYMKQLGKGLVD